MILALLATAAPASAEVLGGVTRLAVVVDLAHPVDGVTADELRRRLAAVAGGRAPAVTLDDGSADRLLLTVAVRPQSASALRGFWLPFSGTYAIGTVRLGLERAVHLPGQAPRTVSAIVWQRERVVATRWSAAGAAITSALQELLDDLLPPGPGSPEPAGGSSVPPRHR